jgi:hypothetical protein
VITAHRTRDALERDKLVYRFEWARLSLIERAMREHGFEPARATLAATDCSVGDTLRLDVNLDLADNAGERLASLHYDLEDGDIGHLSFLYDARRGAGLPGGHRARVAGREEEGRRRRMSETATTKVLMFCGGYDDPEPGLDFFLEPVAFPMDVFNPRRDEEGEPKRLALRNRAQLEVWAKEAFHNYDIWEMEVSEGAIVRKEGG